MTARLRNWYLGLSRREQWLVGIAAVLTAWVVVIFGIVAPMRAAIDAARGDLDEATERRGRIEAKVDAALTRKPQTAPAIADIDLFVSQAAAEQGFDIVKGPAGAPGQIALRIESARASALLGWLSQMEAQGIAVRSISLRGTTSGSLSVDVQLEGRAQ
jgi:general secretion pathway protein M